MKCDWTRGEEALALAREFFPATRFRSPLPVAIVDNAGDVAAAWIWTNYAPGSQTIEFSGCARVRNWLTRGVLTELFDYAFTTAGCQMILARVRADNLELNRQLEALSFNGVHVPRMWGRHDDGILWTLTDDAWLASPFRRRKQNG